MKIKILKDSNIEKLECEVNKFIKDKSIINISNELIPLSLIDGKINVLMIIILYEECSNREYLDYNDYEFWK